MKKETCFRLLYSTLADGTKFPIQIEYDDVGIVAVHYVNAYRPKQIILDFVYKHIINAIQQSKGKYNKPQRTKGKRKI